MSEESKKEAADEVISPSSFLEGLYGDPLREETMRTARHLVIVSAITMAAVLFNVRLQSTSLIPLDFGQRADVLSMLLSLSVVILLVSFLLRATTDLLRDHETDILVTRYIEGERAGAALAAAQDVDADLAEQERQYHEGDYSGGNDPWWDAYIEVKEAADAAVKKVEGRIGIRRAPRILRRIRKALEVGVPTAIALLALVLARNSLVSFARALVGAFW
ncbi:hypothetical protein [Bradyrhizobium sp. SEMIA]|uniref:hypothetical protein n=1 Tax=Bradyrhizobium sp. SEMIA TaxID=2597515 RepID=UPI0018A59DA9|nr:hypothetical protein [Bradyrhizobium sp. SEMIA]QOG17535.1 hypothetical protein FOM02_09450 [Bradyrhizobium sp. SEMIA]